MSVIIMGAAVGGVAVIMLGYILFWISFAKGVHK